MKKVIFTIFMFFILQMPVSFCSASYTMNFLPMEDALSSARNTVSLERSKIKPYRESFSIGTNKTQKEQSLFFSNTDILAFIALAGVYILLVRRRSKPRNISV